MRKGQYQLIPVIILVASIAASIAIISYFSVNPIIFTNQTSTTTTTTSTTTTTISTDTPVQTTTVTTTMTTQPSTCSVGQVRCSGNLIEYCFNGNWRSSGTNCPYGCSNGQCNSSSTSTTTASTTTTAASTSTSTSTTSSTTTSTTTKSTTSSTTTTTPVPCTLISVSITPNCPNGNCIAGNIITMQGTYTGNCQSANFFQIDAISSDGFCKLQYVNGNIQGIYSTPTISGGSISGTYTVSSIPSACQGKTVSASAAGLYNGNPASGTQIGYTNTVTGSLRFATAPTSSTTTTTTSTTTTTTTSSTTTTTTTSTTTSTTTTTTIFTPPVFPKFMVNEGIAASGMYSSPLPYVTGIEIGGGSCSSSTTCPAEPYVYIISPYGGAAPLANCGTNPDTFANNLKQYLQNHPWIQMVEFQELEGRGCGNFNGTLFNKYRQAAQQANPYVLVGYTNSIDSNGVEELTTFINDGAQPDFLFGEFYFGGMNEYNLLQNYKNQGRVAHIGMWFSDSSSYVSSLRQIYLNGDTLIALQLKQTTGWTQPWTWSSVSPYIQSIVSSSNDTCTYGGVTCSGQANIATGYMSANAITLHVGTVTKLGIYIAITGSGNLRLALYSNNNGVPGIPLADTGAVATCGSVGWCEFSVTTPYYVSTPGTFWVAYSVDSTNPHFGRYVSGTNQADVISYTCCSTALPNPYGGTVNNVNIWQMRATYAN